MPSRSELESLKGRLDAAQEGSRELDWRIAEVFAIPEAWKPSSLWPPFMAGSHFDGLIRDFTTDFSSAIALLDNEVLNASLRLERTPGGVWSVRVRSKNDAVLEHPCDDGPLGICRATVGAALQEMIHAEEA